MNTYDSTQFGYRDKTFAIEASDLGWRVGIIESRFLMRSAVTGKIEEFFQFNVIRDSDSDVLFWDYRPKNKDLFDNGVKVHIYND